MAENFKDSLRKLCPGASQKIIDGICNNLDALEAAGINTPLRIRHFFARVCVETGGLRGMEENLNYSTERLCAVWPSRFKTPELAAPYANSPEKLAKKVYGDRLGNFKADDGWIYRGSGLLQNTGRANFKAVEAVTGLPVVENPEMLRTFPGAMLAATTFWKQRGINAMADRNDAYSVCRTINGGINGFEDQQEWLKKAERIWTDDTRFSFSAVQMVPIPVQVSEPCIQSAHAVQNMEKPGEIAQKSPARSDRKAVAMTATAASFSAAGVLTISQYWDPLANWIRHLF